MARIVIYLLCFMMLTVGVWCAESNKTTAAPVTTPATPATTEKPKNVNILEDVYDAIVDIPKGVVATCRDTSKAIIDFFSLGKK